MPPVGGGVWEKWKGGEQDSGSGNRFTWNKVDQPIRRSVMNTPYCKWIGGGETWEREVRKGFSWVCCLSHTSHHQGKKARKSCSLQMWQTVKEETFGEREGDNSRVVVNLPSELPGGMGCGSSEKVQKDGVLSHASLCSAHANFEFRRLKGSVERGRKIVTYVNPFTGGDRKSRSNPWGDGKSAREQPEKKGKGQTLFVCCRVLMDTEEFPGIRSQESGYRGNVKTRSGNKVERGGRILADSIFLKTSYRTGARKGGGRQKNRSEKYRKPKKRGVNI